MAVEVEVLETPLNQIRFRMNLKRYGDEEKIREEYREEFKKGFKEVVEYIQKQLPKLKVILQDQ